MAKPMGKKKAMGKQRRSEDRVNEENQYSLYQTAMTGFGNIGRCLTSGWRNLNIRRIQNDHGRSLTRRFLNQEDQVDKVTSSSRSSPVFAL